MQNYNEYLTYCKENNLNPMDEINLTNYNKKFGTKKIKLSELLADCLDLEVPVKYAELFKKSIKDSIKLYDKKDNFENESSTKELNYPDLLEILLSLLYNE